MLYLLYYKCDNLFPNQTFFFFSTSFFNDWHNEAAANRAISWTTEAGISISDTALQQHVLGSRSRSASSSSHIFYVE